MSQRIFRAKTYLMLTKPGIVLGNAITCTGGFALASRGDIDFWLLLMTLVGLSCIVASGCVSNNYIDRFHDGKMARTKNRALVIGLITPKQAIQFSIFLALFGTFCLLIFVNFLAVLIALFGLTVYLVFYSIAKCRSVYATLIGSVAGAVPPVVGYSAVTGHLDLGSLILFMMIALWQMPHFYAIAMYRLEDYVSASLPVLPIVKGSRTTKIHMLLYILAFMGVSFLLVFLNYVGYLYLIGVTLLSLLWLGLCMKGFRYDNERHWAKNMFRCSLVVVIGLCFMIPFSIV